MVTTQNIALLSLACQATQKRGRQVAVIGRISSKHCKRRKEKPECRRYTKRVDVSNNKKRLKSWRMSLVQNLGVSKNLKTTTTTTIITTTTTNIRYNTKLCVHGIVKYVHLVRQTNYGSQSTWCEDQWASYGFRNATPGFPFVTILFANFSSSDGSLYNAAPRFHFLFDSRSSTICSL